MEREIVAKYCSGDSPSQKSLAAQYNVSQATISRILRQYFDRSSGTAPPFHTSALYCHNPYSLQISANEMQQRTIYAHTGELRNFRNSQASSFFSSEQTMCAIPFQSANSGWAQHAGYAQAAPNAVNSLFSSPNTFCAGSTVRVTHPAVSSKETGQQQRIHHSAPVSGALQGTVTPVAPARSLVDAEILGQGRSTVKDVEPAILAALPMPSTDARQSSTAFAPRPEVPEQLVASDFQGPETRLDKELRDRILQRVEDLAMSREAAQDLFIKLHGYGLPSIASLELMHRAAGLLNLGFQQRDIDLLLLSDPEWQRKYQSGWLDRIFDSLPDAIRHESIKEQVKVAIHKAGITSTATMLSNLESLALPWSFVFFVRQNTGQLGRALPSAEKEPVEQQLVSLLKCADNSHEMSISEGIQYDSDTPLKLLVADNSNKPESATCDDANLLLSIDPTSDGEAIHSRNHSPVPMQSDSETEEAALFEAEQVLNEAHQKLLFDASHSAIDTRESNNANKGHSPGNCEIVEGALADQSMLSNVECPSISGSEVENHTDSGSDKAVRIAAEQLLGFSKDHEQTTSHQSSPSKMALSSADLVQLQRTANRLIVDLPTIAGISGTLREGTTVKFLIEAYNALVTKHDHDAALQCDMVDLGCSVGHVLICGTLSGLFDNVYGVDLPENEINIQLKFNAFCDKAKEHSGLNTYAEKFRHVKFSWANAGDSLRCSNLKDLLGVDSVNPVLIYWFCVGWAAADIANAAKALSNSRTVLCVAVIGTSISTAVGPGACYLLDKLNASSTNPAFRLVKKVPGLIMKGGGNSFPGYIFLRDGEVERQVQVPMSPTRATPKHNNECVQRRVEVLFDGIEWFSGEVSEFDGENGSIKFDDGDSCVFTSGDPSVFFLPTEQGQWKRESLLPKPLRKTFCHFCWNETGKKDHHCDRCGLATAHRSCLSAEPQGNVQAPFLCFVCRAELAESDTSQYPLYTGKLNPPKPVCFGCGHVLSVASGSGSGAKSKNSHRAQTRKDYHQCRSCNFCFGICCTGRTMYDSETYSCPACFGISSHDEELSLSLKQTFSRMEDTVQVLSTEKRAAAVDQAFMEQVGQVVVSLQNNCHFEGSAQILPLAVSMLQHQVRLRNMPSMTEFDLMNQLNAKNGPNYDLFQDVSKLWAKYRAENAGTQKRQKVAENRVPASTTDRISLGYLTADMRETPWWSLYKKALIMLAQSKDVEMTIFSRPPCNLFDDPYFNHLKKYCTIVNFDELASDSAVAAAVREKNVQVLVDGGGPTFNTLVGALAEHPAKVQISHLGYPGPQPNAGIDFTVVDEHTLDLQSLQAKEAEERFMFLRCYQPNAGFCDDDCSLSPPVGKSKSKCRKQVPEVRQTTRADWDLPEEGFVFALFCRLGRIDSEQATCLANILRRTQAQKSVLWMRKSPVFGVLRLLRHFREQGIARDRIILAEDVPGDVHEERIVHADLGLDTVLYGAHTTCSDMLRRGKAFLSLKGKWFQNRVSYSLVSGLMGHEEFVVENLEDFEGKAVLYCENPRLMEPFCEAIRVAITNQTGPFAGKEWVDSYLRCIKEAIRQRKANEEFKDIFAVERIRPATDCAREFVSVLVDTVEDDKMQPPAAQLAGTFQEAGGRSPFVEQVQQDMIPFNSEAPSAAVASGQPVHASEPKMSLYSEQQRIRSEVEWLKQLASSDPQKARLEAFAYIKKLSPDLALKMCFVTNEDSGEQIPFIQLPCNTPRISFETGKVNGYYELPFLFVCHGPHGKHLYSAQDFWKGMTLTRYDGIFVPHGTEVDDISWLRSLAYKLGAIDGRGHGEFSQLKHNSLGHIANHSDHGSIARYVHRKDRAPISELPSIVLSARDFGKAFTEVTAFYTNGSARRHGIPKNPRRATVNIPRRVKSGKRRVKA